MGVDQFLSVRPDQRRHQRHAGPAARGTVDADLVRRRFDGAPSPWPAAARSRVVCSRPRSSWPRSPASTASSTSTWGLLFVAIAIAAFVRSTGDGDRPALVAARPAAALGAAAGPAHRPAHSGKPEDPRYAALLAKARATPTLRAAMVYLLQGLLARSSPRRSWSAGSRGPSGRGSGWASPSGCSACSSRRSATRRWSVPRRPGEQGQGHRRRAVALHPAPELLRRRLRVVGIFLVAATRGPAWSRSSRPA